MSNQVNMSNKGNRSKKDNRGNKVIIGNIGKKGNRATLLWQGKHTSSLSSHTSTWTWPWPISNMQMGQPNFNATEYATYAATT